MKWEWFLGGQIMFWVSIVVFVAFVLIFVTTYVVDPRTITLIKRQPINADVIKEISETYVGHLGITIDKPIEYRFVKYNYKKELGRVICKIVRIYLNSCVVATMFY